MNEATLIKSVYESRDGCPMWAMDQFGGFCYLYMGTIVHSTYRDGSGALQVDKGPNGDFNFYSQEQTVSDSRRYDSRHPNGGVAGRSLTTFTQYTPTRVDE